MSRQQRPGQGARQKQIGGCGPAAQPGRLRLGLDAIIEDFLAKWSEGADDELQFYRDQPTLAAAMEQASMAKLANGKRHPHQYRIPRAALEQATKALRHARLARVRTFDQLHSAAHAAIGPIPGIGELMVYDTSHRIGAKLGLEPDRVYQHAGTRAGARACGVAVDRLYIEVSELPPAFRRLTPAQIEDCLCLYKAELARLRG